MTIIVINTTYQVCADRLVGSAATDGAITLRTSQLMDFSRSLPPASIPDTAILSYKRKCQQFIFK